MSLRQGASSLVFVLIGMAAGYPVLARSKGQICNAPREEGRRIDLSLRKISVDGADAPMPAATDAGFLVKTEFNGLDGYVHLSVLAPDGGVRVVHASRQP